MKIAFCISGFDQPLKLDDRFGRAPGFAVLEVQRSSGDSGMLQTLENTGQDASNGAGTGAVQLLANEGVEGLVAPHLGPKAEAARRQFGMKLWSQGRHATLESALAAWKAGELEDLSTAEAPQGLHRA